MRHTHLLYKLKAEHKKGNAYSNISDAKSVFDNSARNLSYEELTKDTARCYLKASNKKAMN